jgi:hypothetical protein
LFVAFIVFSPLLDMALALATSSPTPSRLPNEQVPGATTIRSGCWFL